MGNWFNTPGRRHLAAVLVNIILTVGLARVGWLSPEQATQIGTAAGAAVGGT